MAKFGWKDWALATGAVAFIVGTGLTGGLAPFVAIGAAFCALYYGRRQVLRELDEPRSESA